MKKVYIVLILVLTLILSSCSATDVIGKNSKKSFDKIYETNIDDIGFVSNKNRFVFTLPTGETFEWSKDFKDNKEDIVFEVDAKPFLDAGLNVNILPDYITLKDGKLIFKFDLSDRSIKYNDKDGGKTFEDIIDKHRDLLGYHEELEHFGLKLAEGYKIEWAKDMDTNDKDIVFILNPQALRELGVDVERVSGWTYTKMKEMDKEVELLLKPFDLK